MIYQWKKRFAFVMLFLFFLYSGIYPQRADDSLLEIKYKGNAEVEIGSHYVGLEFHHSLPLLQRISFYYPVANSIDLSTDYWRRDTSFIMSLRLKVNDGQYDEIGKEPYELNLTPYSAKYSKKSFGKKIEISYNFSKDKPVTILTYELTNHSSETNTYEFETKYNLNLRTSHTFKLKDMMRQEFSSDKSNLFVNYDDKETDSALVFILNAGEKPTGYELTKDKYQIKIDNYWANKSFIKYKYKKTLAPGKKVVIVQAIGSSKQNEGNGIADYITRNYKKEIQNYSDYVLEKSVVDGRIKLNDSVLDHSVRWAKAILAVNAHYIDGSIVPMPCPAEYNFFFTHDVLLTDLAAVNFDLQRVKNDLLFVVNHADKNKTIPHAYYWKDSTYKTEYADADNWNNFWFIILSAKYLMHSGDKDLLNQLYPYVTRSLENALRTKGKDNLMWSYRPDWWDIGKRYGPRSYMTILAIKTLRSFIYLSTVLGKKLDQLKTYEVLASQMQSSLNTKLWADDVNYLMNYYEDGHRDEHLYMGSLLAAHYGLLNKEHVGSMVQTARQNLVAKHLGVYNAFPIDYHTLQTFWNFNGNEAGDPYYYMNGGIWSHANAWYALALSAEGKKDDAIDFVKNTMTVKGIMSGPNGQPAMYEVRNGNQNNRLEYGTVDKPQFLWAAGWYLYDLYNIFLINENDWNLQFNPFLKEDQHSALFDYSINGFNTSVIITGKGKNVETIKFDKKSYPSLVLPQILKDVKSIKLKLGITKSPYLFSTSSLLNSAEYYEKSKLMILELKAFKDHKNKTVLVSSSIPKSIRANGNDVKFTSQTIGNNLYEIIFEFVHQSNSKESVVINY